MYHFLSFKCVSCGTDLCVRGDNEVIFVELCTECLGIEVDDEIVKEKKRLRDKLRDVLAEEEEE